MLNKALKPFDKREDFLGYILVIAMISLVICGFGLSISFFKRLLFVFMVSLIVITAVHLYILLLRSAVKNLFTDIRSYLLLLVITMVVNIVGTLYLHIKAPHILEFFKHGSTIPVEEPKVETSKVQDIIKFKDGEKCKTIFINDVRIVVEKL